MERWFLFSFFFLFFSILCLGKAPARSETSSSSPHLQARQGKVAPPSVFSCLNDLLNLRVALVDRGGGDENFQKDHGGLRDLINPPRFRGHVIHNFSDYYRERFLLAYKYRIDRRGQPSFSF